MSEEKFFSNRELYEMFIETNKELRGAVDELRSEMEDTRLKIKEYNGLIDSMNDKEERLNNLEGWRNSCYGRREGEGELLDGIRLWIPWVLLVLLLLYLVGEELAEVV